MAVHLNLLCLEHIVAFNKPAGFPMTCKYKQYNGICITLTFYSANYVKILRYTVNHTN